MPKSTTAETDAVQAILENYAKRGVFRGFSPSPARRGKAIFTVVWHYDRQFTLVYDHKKGSLAFQEVLANVPADSTMYRELKSFVRGCFDSGLPEHRRIDPERASIRISNRGAKASIELTPSGPGSADNLEYVVRKLVQLVHEIFLTFLTEGVYVEYRVEEFGLDPDSL